MTRFDKKHAAKRRRFTRRELPYGQISLWGKCATQFKRERELALINHRTREQLQEVHAA